MFDRFMHPAIVNAYKNKFFDLFGGRCFKCGKEGKKDSALGHQLVLCMDHHIPMVSGGHLVPGNLVALCRSCNSKKQDLTPEQFYTKHELDELQPLLSNQQNVFDFTFNWDRCNEDRGNYLISLGVDPDIVHELLTNKDSLHYLGGNHTGVGVSITADINGVVSGDESQR